MAFQPAPGVAHCQLIGFQDNQTCINDLYFEVSGGGITPTNLNALALAVSAWWNLNLLPQLSEDFLARRVIATDLTSATGPRAEAAAIATGGIDGEAAPNNVAACISFRTDQRGRSGRGRNYIAGVPNANIVLNTIDAPWMDNVRLVYEMLIGPGEFLAGWQWVVLSRFTAGAPRAAGLAIPITSVTFVTTTVRSMRSRSVGHGS